VIDPTYDPETAAIRRAATHVLGDSPVGNAVVQLCDNHSENLHQIAQSRTPDATTIAVIGATGQGKSWLIQQLVRDPAVRRGIRSGDGQAEATRRLFWIGNQPPTNLDSRSETFLFCATESMTDLGGPYLVVDTPGATDADPSTAEAAARAVSMASVLILTVRREQIRSVVPGQLAAASDGTLILPVVTVVRVAAENPDLRSDVDSLMARLRDAAPNAEVIAPVLVRDFELDDRGASGVGDDAAGRIAEALRSHLAAGNVGVRRRGARLAAERERFHQQIHSQLQHHLPRLTQAVARLDQATEKLPHDVAVELIGSGPTLLAGIRSRLRAEMLVSTAALWFPYRSLLGLLNLTHGAWDRVILALSGSLPSLVGAAWTSIRNVNESREARTSSGAIRVRSSAMIADRIVPLVNRFRNELDRIGGPAATLDSRQTAGSSGGESASVDLMGIDSLQEQTQHIFDDEVGNAAPSPWAIQLCGLAGTLLFWGLLAGPIVSLYRRYFAASVESIGSLADNLDAFPHPSAAMVLTSVVLSLLPTSIFAMLVLTWVQRRSRQQKVANNIDTRIKQAIDDLQSQGVLRLEFRDPILEDTRRLTRVAAAPPSNAGESPN
jgi:hypothetical protein